MYRLIMEVANIRHLEWWWNGESMYRFGNIHELVAFMRNRIPMCDNEIRQILDNDLAKDVGRLASTSWYDVKKGPDQMTEYTSL